MGTEPKYRRDDRYRENMLAAAETAKIALKTAVEVGVPLATFAWTFWRVPWAWIGKPDADSLWLSHQNRGPGVHSEPSFDPLAYTGTLPGMGDRVTIAGTEYKVTPFTDNLLFAARTELRDDLLVALGPLFTLAIAPVEVGVAEKGAVLTAWGVAQFGAVELARFVPKTIRVRWLTVDGNELARREVLVFEMDWLDRLAFSAQAPLLAHLLVQNLRPGQD